MEELNRIDLANVLVEKGYVRGPFGSALKRNEMLSEGVPVYEQQHAIYNNRQFRFFINSEKLKKMKRFQVETDDLIISCSGTVGKVSIICDKDPKGIISQALLLLRPDKSIIDPQYLKYFFLSSGGYDSIISRSSGSVQVNIAKRNVIEGIKLRLPNLFVQRKIVSILISIDDKIKLNAKINNNLEEQVTALYNHIFADANVVRTVCRADEYFDIAIGRTPPRKQQEWFTHNSNDVRWISISDMGKCGTYISNSSEHLTHDAIKKFNIAVIPDNTILLSFKLTVGRIAITDGIMTTNEAIAHFKVKDTSINPYLHCYLKQFNYQGLGSTSSIATAVNSKIIKSMPFVIPSNNELKQFNELALPSFATIKSNQAETRNLINLKDTLLPKLMSGELDVSELEI